jgi:hypothetical protein
MKTREGYPPPDVEAGSRILSHQRTLRYPIKPVAFVVGFAPNPWNSGAGERSPECATS